MRFACGVVIALMLSGSGCSQQSAPLQKPSESQPENVSAPETVTAPAPTWPALPAADTPYLNANLETEYVGSAACTRCHASSAGTYHHTAMSVSMLPVDIEQEPPDGQYDHRLSSRRYTISRRDGQMWHTESKVIDGVTVLLSEYPVKYVVGSGRHSRSYLVEAEGFLVESPITWYSIRKEWGMSPGYDRQDHLGFERATGQGCLECHAGRTAPIDKSLHRMKIIEESIGCERCHGPGAKHLEKHRDFDPSSIPITTTGTDFTIVNPANLSRELAEAVCQQCHLRSNATVVARGHGISDFRPGLPLSQSRHDFRLEAPNTPLTVVSHVEQMHLSRCYQQSETMSCRTCHNPHASRDAERTPQHFNAVCATCHQSDACEASMTQRSQTIPADNCIQCHMPRGDTEIPHLAFTHHRILRDARTESPPTDPEAAPKILGDLRPLIDLHDWSKEDRQRSLGLAYAELAQRMESSPEAETYRRRAWALLIELHDAGYHEAHASATLAQLAFQMQSPLAESFAAEALADPLLAGQDRCNVLFLLADAAIHEQQPAAAIPFAKELTSLRRQSLDWLMRAQAERATHQDFVTSLETAVGISPQLANIHQALSEHYSNAGNRERAEHHRRLAKP